MNKDTNLRLSDAQVLNDAEKALAKRMYAQVESACNSVLERSPRSSRAFFLLGISALRQNDIDAAMRRLKKALRIVPGDINCIVAMGQANAAGNHQPQAEEWFRKANGLSSNNQDILRLLILCLMNQGKYQQALVHLDRLLLLKPDDADAFNKRGFILQQFEKFSDAMGNFTRALLLQPVFPEALNNRGNSLKSQDRDVEAILDYDSAIEQRPDYLLPYSNRALSLQALGRHDEAIESCDRALQLNPNFLDAINNKGFVLQKIGRFEESVTLFERALALNSYNWGALNNMAYSLQQLGRFGDSAECYERMMELRPDHPEAMWNRGLLKLLRGDMPSGWSDMEWRWKCKEFKNKPGQAGTPEWQGENIAGRSIAVFVEQGFGDQFQFCRYLPKLADLGAKVVLVAPPLVHRVLATLDPRVVLAAPGRRLPDIDYQCTMLSLPNLFQTRISTIPADIPYLSADENLIKHWKQRLPSGGLNVGISWQGNPSGHVDFGRSVPLSALVPLSDVAGINLISLQFQHGTEQIADNQERMSLHVLPGFNQRDDGFVDTAAVMKNLDLIITSDSAPAHLAGALNVPVWVLLKRVPDWRWLLDRSDSPWYPSMKLFRQAAAGDWTAAIAEITSALEAAVAATRGH